MRKFIYFVLFVSVNSLMFIEGKDVRWDYPVKPGSEAWRKLEDNESKVEACQIPNEVLKKLSTEDLFEIVLNYPLLYDVYAFNDINVGLEKLQKDFNGVRELLSRHETPLLLLECYSQNIRDISNILKNDAVKGKDKGSFILRLSMYETFLLIKKVQENIPKELEQKFIEALNVGYEEKMMSPEYFSGFGLWTSIQSIKRLVGESFEDKVQKRQLVNMIYSPVVTPNGSIVPAWILGESSLAQREAFDDYYTRAYPNAIKIETYDGYSSTRKFNCHGYAWHRMEHDNLSSADRWIGLNEEENDPENIYISDGSYQQLSNNVYGAKIVWSQGDHTAVSIGGDWCISKWNEWPLMRHRINDSPFGSTGLTYYYYNYNLNINGPDYISDNEIGTFSVVNPPQGTITWSVSSNLQIISGQSTSQVQVCPTNGGSGTGTIIATINTLTSSKSVEVNIPCVKTITGPTSGYMGQTLYFNAAPIYSTSLGTYMWSVTPYSGLTTWQWQAYFTPSSSGTYAISCYFKRVSGDSTIPVTVYCNVSSSKSYWSVSSSNKIVTIKSTVDNTSLKSEEIEYMLYNQTTGTLIDSGKMSNHGTTLNYSSFPKGIYLLRIRNSSNHSESFKIVL